MNSATVESAPDSLEGFVAEMNSISIDDRLDMTTFVLKIKAMILKMEHKARSARLRSSFYHHLASVSVPKSLHCLTLLLAEEYSINSLARSSLPESHHISCLTNASYLHIALLTDNILAASVVISSTIKHSKNPNKLIFHIITDKKTFFAMHAWFALHQAHPAVVEVKGLHQFDLSADLGRSVVETIKEVRLSKSMYSQYGGGDWEVKWLESLKPSSYSLLNYLKIHLPEFFPKLEKVILLEDDVVVQCDLAELYNLNLGGKVIGSIIDTIRNEEDNTTLCIDPDKRIDSYLNFSNPIIINTPLGSAKDNCTWSWGVNIFDLRAWRQSNITKTYQFWLRKNRESGLLLWPLGSLAPALIAFNGFMHPIESSWLVSDLGWNEPDPSLLQSHAVFHFNGPAKPWLEIGYLGSRELWRAHLNSSDEFLRTCGVIE
ncbi:putative galacturonosyltransferase 15 isoform X3 [Carex rostrata]